MRAITVHHHGGPEVLMISDVRIPEPADGEVLIRVVAAGVNYIDTYIREGVYPGSLPYIPGSEGSGIVEALGPGASGVSPGDRVAWCQVPGSYAQYVCAPVSALVPVPAGVDDDAAASMLLQGLTAHYLITDSHRAKPGQTVLITAGAGGVGHLLIQMALHLGYRVITTTSTRAKADVCRRLGAHHVLLYPEATSEHIRELSRGGVTTVFDGVGRDTFDTGLDSLARRGTIVLYGAASGPVAPVDPQRLNSSGSVFLTRPTLADYIATPDEFRARTTELLGWLADGTLSLSVGASFALTDAAAAHSALQSRSTSGAVVLHPGR